MSKEEYTEIDNYNLSEMLFNRDERLIEMIKGLREERDYIFNKLTCEKGYLQEKLDKKEDRIDKAIEYINLWVVDEYSIAIIDEENKHFCKYEPNAVEILLGILRGEDNGK